MSLRLPLLPTVLVAGAVATMIALGIWQLQRKGEKEALIAQYASARNLPAISWPSVPFPDTLPLFRKSALMCVKVMKWDAVSGKNARGKAGFAHIAHCQTSGAEGPGAKVAIGWTARPESPDWKGGAVEGVIAPDNEALIRLVASKAPAGLEALAKPSTDSIPNNHLAYAAQWFLFAAAAAVIYLLALRKKQGAI